MFRGCIIELDCRVDDLLAEVGARLHLLINHRDEPLVFAAKNRPLTDFEPKLLMSALAGVDRLDRLDKFW